MNVIYNGEVFANGICGVELCKGTEELAMQPVALRSDAGEILDLRAELFDISVTGVTRNDPDAIKIIANDICLLIGYILKENFNCDVYASNSIGSNSIGSNSIGGQFHCDFHCTDRTLSTKDFEKITSIMLELIESNVEITRSSDEFYIGNVTIKSKAPHSLTVQNIGKHFILTGISGLQSQQLDQQLAQRIAGQIFLNHNEFIEYKKLEEEAREYDHKVIGSRLGIFRTDSEIAPGMITWLPNGAKLLEKIKSYIRNIMSKNDYREVITPLLADVSLWKKTGHWDLYKENMFFLNLDRPDSEACSYALKPMNCPLHVEIFKYLCLSYKDMPYKMSEFGSCNRYEASGALNGLLRVRGFTQDDAHVFCMENQIEEVVLSFCKMLKEAYNKFTFYDIEVRLSTRPDKFTGSKETWDLAEASLASIVEKTDFTAKINPGDGAFYGPKLDFHVKDSRGRVWQCGTVQLDFGLAEKLGASYVGSDGKKKTPIMVHHAVCGSLERFIGVLLEHTKGQLPFWLSPIQIMILPINSNCIEYAYRIQNELTKNNFSSNIDLGESTISYKVRRSTELKVPVLCIVGNEEKSSDTVSLRINGQPFGDKISIESMLNNLHEMENAS